MRASERNTWSGCFTCYRGCYRVLPRRRVACAVCDLANRAFEGLLPRACSLQRVPRVVVGWLDAVRKVFDRSR